MARIDSTFRNVVKTASANFVAPASLLLVGPILARALGVDGRGALASALAPTTLFISLAALGIPDAVTYFSAKSQYSQSRIIRTASLQVLVSGAAGTIILLALSSLLSGNRAMLTGMISIAALSLLPNMFVGVLRGSASGASLWRLVNREKYLTAISRLVAIGVFFLGNELTLYPALIISVLSPLFGALAYLGLARGQKENVERGDTSQPGSGPRAGIFRYGLSAWLGSIAGILLSRLDQTLLTPLADLRQLGLYAIAVSVSEVLLLTSNAVRDVLLSAEASAPDGDRIRRYSRNATTVGLVSGGLLCAVTPFAIPLLFGAAFSDSEPMIFILVGGVVIGFPGAIAGAGLAARGLAGVRSKNLVIAAVINVAALFALVPILGGVGASIATLIGNLVAGHLNVLYLSRLLGQHAGGYYIPAADISKLLRRRALRRGP